MLTTCAQYVDGTLPPHNRPNAKAKTVLVIGTVFYTVNALPYEVWSHVLPECPMVYVHTQMLLLCPLISISASVCHQDFSKRGHHAIPSGGGRAGRLKSDTENRLSGAGGGGSQWHLATVDLC